MLLEARIFGALELSIGLFDRGSGAMGGVWVLFCTEVAFGARRCLCVSYDVNGPVEPTEPRGEQSGTTSGVTESRE